MQLLAWALQILILSAGIHLFLRFVRNTRGNRLIRGLFVSVLVGVVGLWGLSKALGLEELEHLLQGSTGFIVVGLAIVFQSELRRGIAQLGEHPFIGPLGHTAKTDTLREVARAARAMAARRDGALIAFERETSLQPWVESGTRIDSGVESRLLESLFYPGTALHDGAVIIKKDRVAAAGCFFPLPEHTVVDSSHGTRHRAALGITEETDAVVLVVSEETGALSLAKGGKLTLRVEPDRLLTELREYLDDAESGAVHSERRIVTALSTMRRDVAWIAGSVLMACGILFVAHRDIQETREYAVRVADAGPGARRKPRSGELLVVLPADNYRLVAPERDQSLKISVTGTRSQFDEIGGALRGTLEHDDDEWNGGPIDLSAVQWEESIFGLEYSWTDRRTPELVVERYGPRLFDLEPDSVVVDSEELDPRYRVRTGEIAFEPSSTISVVGPLSRLGELGSSVPLELRTVRLGADDRGDHRERIRLDAGLESEGFSLDSDTPVEVLVPIEPVQREVGTINREIVLVCLDPDRAAELDRWSLPANSQTTRFTIVTSGLIPVDADAGSPAMRERAGAIRRFVEENLRVFVDVADLPPRGEGRLVPIRWTWREDWRDSLDSLGLEGATLGGREELNIRLEGEAQVLLEGRAAKPAAATFQRESGSGG